MFENVGAGEILLIMVVILIFFGPKKIPELAHSLGKGLRKFNDAKEGFESQMKTVMKEPMEAIQDAKLGFERHINDAVGPLKESFANTLPGGTVVTQSQMPPMPEVTTPFMPFPPVPMIPEIAPTPTIAPSTETASIVAAPTAPVATSATVTSRSSVTVVAGSSTSTSVEIPKREA
ncbi:MAG: twin-arginine translocase TatA/TatE family subunit [Candidatus Kapaibacterium sp.]|jgi:sec-independent protein translocase protein TatA